MADKIQLLTCCEADWKQNPESVSTQGYSKSILWWVYSLDVKRRLRS